MVANEVKELAKQTAKATEEIGRQIGQVQASTQDTVTAIREITGVIQQVNEVSSSISAAKPASSAQRRYMRNSISPQSWDSVPPSPGWIDKIASRSS